MKKRIIKIKAILTLILILICIAGLIYSSINIINWKKNTTKNKEIKQQIDEAITIVEEQENKYIVDFEKLKEQNKDTIAYLKVNNTNIDYVVVKTTNNDYYIRHNFNKEYNVAGWIFIDYRNKLDGTDKNIVIYGHNMKDGSMFSTLEKTQEKTWIEQEENQNITLITQDETAIYKIFSTYIIEPEDYYIKTKFKDKIEYTTFLNTIKQRSDYNYNVNLTEEDTILTLSTCTNNGKKRIVVHAKKINLEQN